MRQVLWIPGKLPSYTDLLDKMNVSRHAYNSFKGSCEQRVLLVAHQARLKQIVESHQYAYLFVEPNRRRDPSNILSGAVKLIEDALRAGKYLPNDGWAWVHGITPYFTVVREGLTEPGTLLLLTHEIEPVGLDELEDEATKKWIERHPNG